MFRQSIVFWEVIVKVDVLEFWPDKTSNQYAVALSDILPTKHAFQRRTAHKGFDKEVIVFHSLPHMKKKITWSHILIFPHEKSFSHKKL